MAEESKEATDARIEEKLDLAIAGQQRGLLGWLTTTVGGGITLTSMAWMIFIIVAGLVITGNEEAVISMMSAFTGCAP